MGASLAVDRLISNLNFSNDMSMFETLGMSWESEFNALTGRRKCRPSATKNRGIIKMKRLCLKD